MTATATASCERCGKPATHHEVEIVQRRRVPHHLCDEHGRQRESTVRSKELRYGTQRITFPELLRRMAARVANDTTFPAEMVFPAGMVPLPDGACSVCGGTACDRQLSVTRDGEVVGDVIFCAKAHATETDAPGPEGLGDEPDAAALRALRPAGDHTRDAAEGGRWLRDGALLPRARAGAWLTTDTPTPPRGLGSCSPLPAAA
jgi:hypothetical protein